MTRIRRWTPLLAALLVATTALSGCTTDEVAGPTSSPDATTSPAATPLPPIGEADVEEKGSDDFPTGGGEIALLTDVRVSAHDDFDRIVFEFRGEDVPSWRAGYVEPPVREDGSGHEVSVAGDAFLEVRVAPASGVDLSGDEPHVTYEGDDRIEPSGTAAVRELVLTGDFEAQLAWVAGVDERQPFAARFLEAPLRLVVDVFRG